MKLLKLKLQIIFKILFLRKDLYLEVRTLQRIKGIKKYGKPLEYANYKDYDWEQMILEEVVDAIQYQDYINNLTK